jgi:hypothetical protein
MGNMMMMTPSRMMRRVWHAVRTAAWVRMVYQHASFVVRRLCLLVCCALVSAVVPRCVVDKVGRRAILPVVRRYGRGQFCKGRQPGRVFLVGWLVATRFCLGWPSSVLQAVTRDAWLLVVSTLRVQHMQPALCALVCDFLSVYG